MVDRRSTEKIRRTTEDILLVQVDDEDKYRKENYLKIKKHVEEADHRCTVCNEAVSVVLNPHPALRVLTCWKCSARYEESDFPQDKDGTDLNCRWCSEKAVKFKCGTCTCTFCEVSTFLITYSS